MTRAIQLATLASLLLALVTCGRPGSSQATASRTADRPISRLALLAEMRGWVPRYTTLEPARDRLVERLEEASSDDLPAIKAEFDHLRHVDTVFPDATSDDLDNAGYLR